MSEEQVEQLRAKFAALKASETKDKEREAAGLGPEEETDLQKMEKAGWAVEIEGRENEKRTQLDISHGFTFHEAILERSRLEQVYLRDGFVKGVWRLALPGTSKSVRVSVKWLGE